MSWLTRLVETYDACLGAEQFSAKPLPPISHTPQQAHVEIVLDSKGHFVRAAIVRKDETLVPATEESASRSGTKPPPHPLCDKIQYVAADYPSHGGEKPSFHAEFLVQLRAWCESPHAHPKARAVLEYVQRGTVVADLVQAGILHLGRDGRLLMRPPEARPNAGIFELLPGSKGEQDQGSAFVRWVVESPGDHHPQVWRDTKLQQAWIAFYASRMQNKGLCMATGTADAALSASHPKRLRHAGDGAKLISSNDASGYTFRGRFTDNTGAQACAIGYQASQKAHLALRWLIARQAFRNGDQVIVAWAVTGQPIPDPLADSFALFGLREPAGGTAYRGDAGQLYSLALTRKVAGYRAALPSSARVVIMGLDAATPGRMAVTFYRELGGAEFLDRLERWHTWFAWPQNFGKERHFVGTPAPREIAESAYGVNLDERLRKSCVERLLPCIVDMQPLPREIFESTYRRVIRRVGIDRWEWERALGVACALYRGYQTASEGEAYQMALETDRTTRDYLFGRLLAIAEQIESRALYAAGESRDTHAAKLMHRFAERPATTWRQMELALAPSRSRLRSRSPGYLHQLEQQIDLICTQFQPGDFVDERRLTGEFLLGYHCQRAKLQERRNPDVDSAGNIETETENAQ